MAEVRALSLVMLTPSMARARVGAEHHALAGLQHGAELIGARLVPRVRAIALAHGAAGVAQRFGDPLGLDLQPLLAVGADLGERERGAIHLRGFAQQAQHFGHGLHGIRRFEQQAAGLGRGRQQPFALEQVLGVEDALGGGGEVDWD